MPEMVFNTFSGGSRYPAGAQKTIKKSRYLLRLVKEQLSFINFAPLFVNDRALCAVPLAKCIKIRYAMKNEIYKAVSKQEHSKFIVIYNFNSYC